MVVVVGGLAVRRCMYSFCVNDSFVKIALRCTWALAMRFVTFVSHAQMLVTLAANRVITQLGESRAELVEDAA